MNRIDHYKQLEYLLELIEKGQVSSPHGLTESFGKSEKSIRNMINELRIQGYSVEYCRKAKKYFLK